MVRDAIKDVLAQPEVAIEMAERLRAGSDHAARLRELERGLARIEESERRLVDLYADGPMTRDVLDQKQDELMKRRSMLERERAQLRAASEPGPDPEPLRELMPEVLVFIRDWVQEAEGDELMLLEALDTQVRAAPEEAEVRVEVPRIEAFKGADLATIVRTWV